MWSAAMLIFWGGGCPFWQITMDYIDVDYKKYLGPDWKPSKEPPTGIICNHQSWFDIFVNMYFQSPSHIAKASVRKIPFIGPCAAMFGCLFIERDKTQRDGKDQKGGDMFSQIVNR